MSIYLDQRLQRHLAGAVIGAAYWRTKDMGSAHTFLGEHDVMAVDEQ
jgi:hypothetical protein